MTAKEPRIPRDRSPSTDGSLPRQRDAPSGRRSHLSRPLSAKRGSDQPQPRAVGLALSVVPVPAAKTRASSCQSTPAAAPATLECADLTRVPNRGGQRAGRTEGWGPGIAPDCLSVYWSIARANGGLTPPLHSEALPHRGSVWISLRSRSTD